ncbi:MAG: glutamine synthetase beta-grasp domain-containing protein [Candidatus Bathyarchaeota archaeon]
MDAITKAQETIGFDGSSVRGFKAINESDMILKPAADTLSIIPWTMDNDIQRSAIILGDVYEAFGGNEPSVVDPRGYVAKNAVKAAAAMGYTGFFGPELEYFVFNSIDPTKLVWDMWVSPKGGAQDSWGAPRVVPQSAETTPGAQFLRPKEAYFRPPPDDTTVEYRNEVAHILEENFDTEIEMHHHEVATNGQIEIDFKYGDLVKTADRTLLYKFVAKNVAKQHGLVATFMPMSQTGRYFIGGLLDHARAITAITCPTVNSYKRLVPGFEAPIFIMWSRRNRSAMIRVPVYFKGPEHAAAKRAELRSADPSCNSYLALSVILMAGLDGIKKKTEPGDPVDEDVYELPTERRKAMGIKELPTSLKDALEAMKSDEVVHKALGSHIFDAFIDYKTNDWNQFCLYVTPWEIMKYLDY